MGSGVRTFNVTGVVTRVTSEGPYGGAIFRIRSKSSSSGVRVCASYRVMRDAPWLGEVLEARGTYSDSGWGQQLEACLILRNLPEREQVVSFIEHHPYFIGVGRRTVSSLWRKQGDRLYELMDNEDVSGLVEQGLTVLQARILVRGWKQYCTEVQIQRYAIDRGLPVSAIEKANAMWGNEALGKINKNPYCLLLFERWAPIDLAALTVFRLKSDSPLRCRGACLKVLNDAATSGRLSLKESEATRSIVRHLSSDALAVMAIKDCVRSGDVRKLGRETTSRLQAQGAAMLQQSLAQAMARRRLLGCASKGSKPISEKDEYPSMRIVFLDEKQRVWNEKASVSGQRSLHMFSSNTTLSKLRPLVGAGAMVSVQDVLASGLSLASSVDSAYVHDATALNFSAMHALLRRLDEVSRVTLLCYTPCKPESYFRESLLAKTSCTRDEVAGVLGRTHLASWVATTHEASNPETLQRSMSGTGHYTRLAICARGPREAFDAACGQFRMCLSVGNSLLITMTRASANLMNRQFHVENLAVREYQSLPCPVAALTRHQFATVGDQVIWDGNNFERRLLRGARGVVLEVWKRGFIEVDEHGVHEIAMTICFDGVGEVRIRRREISLLRLGYASSFLDPVLPRVEFVVLLLARSRFPESDAVAFATSRAASATVAVGTVNDFRRACIAV